MFEVGICLIVPVWESTIWIGLIRSMIVCWVHWLKVGGPTLRKIWRVFDEMSLDNELKLTVTFFVYLQDDAPEGNLSAIGQT